MRVSITADASETHVGIYDADGEQEGGAFVATPDGLVHLVVVRSDGEGGYSAARNYVLNVDRGTITEV